MVNPSPNIAKIYAETAILLGHICGMMYSLATIDPERQELVQMYTEAAGLMRSFHNHLYGKNTPPTEDSYPWRDLSGKECVFCGKVH